MAPYENSRECETAARDKPPVFIQLDTLSDGLKVLHERLTMLEKRLDSVISPRPIAEKCPDPAGKCSSKLSERINQESAKVTGAIERISYLLDCLDI